MVALVGNDLRVESARQDAIAAAAQKFLTPAFEDIARRLNVGFKHRLKGSREIYRKVLRKRDEFGVDHSCYNPLDVEDAWGGRFITLIQPEILDVLEDILELTRSSSWCELEIKVEAVDYFSSRADNDPLSIHNLIHLAFKEFAKTSESKFCLKSLARSNKETGYSSLHLKMSAVVPVDLGDGEKRRVSKFELQIRDVFEDAWGEISHRLAYKRHALGGETEAPNLERQLRNARSRELNALKASADACSQHATLIDRSLTYYLDSAGLEGTEATVGSLAEDSKQILRALGDSAKKEHKRLIADAYRLSQAADESAARELDNKIACGFYSAAAVSFKETLALLSTDQLATRALGFPIRYYISIEAANASVRSVRPVTSAERREAKPIFDQAIREYGELLATDEFRNDATLLLRMGQAQVRAAETLAQLEEAIKTLKMAGHQSAEDAQFINLSNRNWLLLEVLLQSGFALYQKSQMAKAVRNLPLYKSLLSETVNASESIEQQAQTLMRSNSGNINLAHKCINNALYFSVELLRHTRELKEHDEADKVEKIKHYIKLLRQRPYRVFVETHTETIDTIMRAAEIVGQRGLAIDYADKNVLKLRQVARARCAQGDPKSLLNMLDSSEKKMYRAAMRLSRPLDDEDEDRDD